MSRHGYSEVDPYDDAARIRYINHCGAVKRAATGKRGQAFLRDLLQALDEMPEKRLVAGEFETNGEFCTIAALGQKRGISLADLDPEDDPWDAIGARFGIAPSLAREIMYENDEFRQCVYGPKQDDAEARWRAMRAWVAQQIVVTADELLPLEGASE